MGEGGKQEEHWKERGTTIGGIVGERGDKKDKDWVGVKAMEDSTSFPGPLCSEACGRQRPWQRLVVT